MWQTVRENYPERIDFHPCLEINTQEDKDTSFTLMFPTLTPVASFEISVNENVTPAWYPSGGRTAGQSLTSWLMSTMQDTHFRCRGEVSAARRLSGEIDSINLWMGEILNRIMARRKVKVNLIAYYSHDHRCHWVFGDKDLQSHLLYITENKGAADICSEVQEGNIGVI